MNESPSRRFLIVISGVVGMGAALALTYAAGAFIRAVPYPPARFGGLIIGAVPGDFATEMIERLGHSALISLAVAVHAGALGFAGWLSLIIRKPHARRTRARRGLLFGASVFGVAVLLGLTAPEGLSFSALLIYLVASYVCARGVAGAGISAALDPEVKAGDTPLDAIRRSRRKFVVRTGAAVGGFVVGGAATLRFFSGKLPVNVQIAAADLPFDPPPEDPSFPEVPGLSREVTLTKDFYTVDINLIKPNIDAQTWTLSVGGLVDRPLVLGYAELQKEFEVVEMAHTLTCISNTVGGDLISTAVWRGVRLKDVLERAGLKGGVVDIVFRSAEGYSDSIKFEKALEETTLVVFGMNGKALPKEHGFPARIIVPGIYGMKNVKWLTKIEAVDHDYQGYWMVRGWSDIANVKTQSRIDVPGDRDVVPKSAQQRIAGVAWAGDRRISKVEVSDDGGVTWKPALLKRELSPLTWRLWASDLSPANGERRLMVRSTDGKGSTQESRKTDPHPQGASGWHTIRIK